MWKLTLFTLALLGVSAANAVAAPDFETATRAGASGLEAVLFEAPGCRYCEVFRRDVLPTYESTPVGRQAPLRFVDLNAPDVERFRLSRPVNVVPTVVLLKNGVEIGRIDGYVGRQNFHRLFEAMLGAE